MRYNIHYDICSVVIYLFTLYYIIYKKGTKKIQNRIFLAMVLNGLLSAVFDITGAVINSDAGSYSAFTADVFNYLYLMIHNSLPILFCVYVIVVSGIYLKADKKFYLKISIPFFIEMLAFLLNPFLDWVFYFDENNVYCHGPAIGYMYICALFYTALGIFYIVKNSGAIPRAKKDAFIMYIVSGMLVVVLQLFFPNILLELFIQSIVLLGVLFTIENEDEIINHTTNVCNRTAFIDENTIAVESGIGYQIIEVKITNIRYYNTILGVLTMNGVREEIAAWLDKISGKDNSVYDCENGCFSIIIYNGRQEEIDSMMEMMRERFNKEWVSMEISVPLNIQLCLIEVPYDADTVEKLLTLIDTVPVLNEKSAAVMSGDQLRLLQRKTDVEKAIQRAIDRQSFKVFYQPIWDVKANVIHSAEALIRLYDKELGMISPDEFIPIAEQNGTIVEIGLMVFEEVCRVITQEKIEKYGIEFIEVNLSTVQCMHMKLVESIKDIVERNNVDASRINLEITESAAADNSYTLIETMKQLREMGFTFSMDDYGTGYSNFSYMFDLDFNIIKIDKSILWNADKNKNAYIILRNTAHMLKEMDFKIVVEGVETEAHKNKVASLGCDYCQGFYFSKPIDRESFVRYCRKYNNIEQKNRA